MTLYHRTGFLVGDACALIEVAGRGSTLIIRDIEAARARKHARADRVVTPADLVAAKDLSPDRETHFAQAAAAFLVREGVRVVTGDRTLPLSFVDMIRRAGVAVEYDAEMGVVERRTKSPGEIEHVRAAQAATEAAVEMACVMIARSTARADGVLMVEGAALSAERVRAMIAVHLLNAGYAAPPSIVAGGACGADCHEHGHGELRTGEPVIIDVFPQSKSTMYQGDCTRTVVHGTPTAELVRMHAAVVEAKAAATRALRAGVHAGDVHAATIGALAARGFARAIPAADAPRTFVSLQHGTGHGLGLDGHEPPLLDGEAGTGPVLLAGEVVTVEPGLYSVAYGGVRVEDALVVTAAGCGNLGRAHPRLHEGLDWR
jgi:Xaa-Pro aminopeptidase